MKSDDITLRDLWTLSKEIDSKLDRFNCRIISLEKWRASIKGQIAVYFALATAVVSVMVTIFSDWIKDKLGI